MPSIGERLAKIINGIKGFDMKKKSSKKPPWWPV